jgi:hypothetical protein
LVHNNQHSPDYNFFPYYFGVLPLKLNIMKLSWFRRVGLVYVPRNIAGWIILVVSLGFAAYLFFDIDGRSHSISDTLINFMLNFLIIGAFYTLIAFMTSSRTSDDRSEDNRQE